MDTPASEPQAEAETRAKAEREAMEALLAQAEEQAKPVIGMVEDAFTDGPVTWPIPTGRRTSDDRKVVVNVTVRDPGLSSEAVAMELAKAAAGDQAEFDRAVLRLWRVSVVEPREILVDPESPEHKKAISDWSKAVEAARQAGVPPPRKPRCFTDTTMLFRNTLTNRIQTDLMGIDGDFIEGLLKKYASPKVVRQAMNSRTSLPVSTGLPRGLSSVTPSATREPSSAPTPGPASSTTASASTQSSPSPRDSEPRTPTSSTGGSP